MMGVAGLKDDKASSASQLELEQVLGKEFYR